MTLSDSKWETQHTMVMEEGWGVTMVTWSDDDRFVMCAASMLKVKGYIIEIYKKRSKTPLPSKYGTHVQVFVFM